MLTVHSNMSSLIAQGNLSRTSSNLSAAIERLSSGTRINRAADDAAGLSISEKLRAQIGGLTTASRNAQDGISVVQTADGALKETANILQRMRDLSLHYSNGATDTDGQAADQAEFDTLAAELDRIDSATTFGGTALLGGAYNKDFNIGANGTDTITVDMSAMAVDSTTLSVATGSMASVATIDTAITTVSGYRGTLGALQNRFEHTINNLTNTQQNLTAAESRIRDTDMALESSFLVRSQILTQAGVAMMAQANTQPAAALRLLRG